jgi:hypothetical protein
VSSLLRFGGDCVGFGLRGWEFAKPWMLKPDVFSVEEVDKKNRRECKQ